MKGINTPGQAMDSGGVASFSAPRDGVSHLAFLSLRWGMNAERALMREAEANALY